MARYCKRKEALTRCQSYDADTRVSAVRELSQLVRCYLMLYYVRHVHHIHRLSFDPRQGLLHPQHRRPWSGSRRIENARWRDLEERSASRESVGRHTSVDNATRCDLKTTRMARTNEGGKTHKTRSRVGRESDGEEAGVWATGAPRDHASKERMGGGPRLLGFGKAGRHEIYIQWGPKLQHK